MNPSIPTRVVSLLPAATEMVWALGAGDRLVGRSHECDFPAEVRRLPVLTAPRLDPAASSATIDEAVRAALGAGQPLYRLDVDRLRSLRPELILTQAQCAICAVSPAELGAALAGWPGTPPQVLTLAPAHFADLWTDLRRVGTALGLPDEGRFVLTPLKTRVVNLIERMASLDRKPRVACLEWLEPLMGAGNWIPELVELAGGENVFGKAGEHSGWLTWPELVQADPDVILALPCGFDLARTRAELSAVAKRPEWNRLSAVRTGRVYLTDGNAYFNRPGPRLVDSLEILGEILHPELLPQSNHRGNGWLPAETR